jgi:hypothetical protein
MSHVQKERRTSETLRPGQKITLTGPSRVCFVDANGGLCNETYVDSSKAVGPFARARQVIIETIDEDIDYQVHDETLESVNVSAALDLTTTEKAFIPPRMATEGAAAIVNLEAGMVVFNTTLAKLCVYNGTAWETITSVVPS